MPSLVRFEEWRLIVDTTSLVSLALVGGAYVWTAFRRRQSAAQAARVGLKSFRGMATTFVAVFGLVGLFEVYIPASLIGKWMGHSAGVLSLLTGGVLGSVAAGPPAAAFPIARTLLDGGAWMPAVAAFIVSWVLVGVVSLPFEAKVFGARFALIRNGGSFLVALLIGLIMGWLL